MSGDECQAERKRCQEEFLEAISRFGKRSDTFGSSTSRRKNHPDTFPRSDFFNAIRAPAHTNFQHAIQQRPSETRSSARPLSPACAAPESEHCSRSRSLAPTDLGEHRRRSLYGGSGGGTLARPRNEGAWSKPQDRAHDAPSSFCETELAPRGLGKEDEMT